MAMLRHFKESIALPTYAVDNVEVDYTELSTHYRTLDELTQFTSTVLSRHASLEGSATKADAPYATLLAQQSLREYAFITRALAFETPALEADFADKALNVLQMIVKAVSKVLSFVAGLIKSLWTRYLSEATNLRRSTDVMVQKASRLTSDSPDNPVVSTYASALLLDGYAVSGGALTEHIRTNVKYSAAILQSTKKESKELAKRHKKVLKGLSKIDSNDKLSGEILSGYKDVIDSLEGQVNKWGLSQTSDMASVVRDSYALREEGVRLFSSERLLGDVAIYAILPNASMVTDVDTALWWSNTANAGIYLQNKEEMKKDSVSTLTPGEIAQVAGISGVLLEGVVAFKQAADDMRKFIGECESLTVDIEKNVLRGGEITPLTQKSISAGISLSKAVSGYHGRVVTEHAQYQMRLSRVLLHYCYESLKEYK